MALMVHTLVKLTQGGLAAPAPPFCDTVCHTASLASLAQVHALGMSYVSWRDLHTAQETLVLSSLTSYVQQKKSRARTPVQKGGCAALGDVTEWWEICYRARLRAAEMELLAPLAFFSCTLETGGLHARL